MRRLLVGMVLFVPLLAIVVAGAEPDAAHALPPGFTDELVTVVDRPTAIEYLPNDTIIVTEQHSGQVLRVDRFDGSLSTAMPTLPTGLSLCTGEQQGLLGLTDDPVSRRVFMFYTRPVAGGCVSRVSAFTTRTDQFSGRLIIDRSSEQVLLDDIPAPDTQNGGDLEIGNDGYLYVTVGDGGTDPRSVGGSGPDNPAAVDDTILNGKILRIDPRTGAGAPDNPVGAGAVPCGTGGINPLPAAVCQEIFALGLRNPFRFARDPNTNDRRFFVNDVGQDAQEEINSLGDGGDNFGWPAREGVCPAGEVPPCDLLDPMVDPLVDPIVAYTHETGTNITGGAFVPDGSWPEEYDGGYFFADGGAGKVWFMDKAGDVDFDEPFLTDRFGIADMTFVLENDGWALWYTLNGSDEVRRVRYSFPAPSVSGPLVYERLDVAQRVFDSRDAPAARIRAGHTRLVDLGPGAVGAQAALVNITVVDPVDLNYATVWEPRTRRPATSNLNARFGAVANASVVPVDDEGRILLYTRAASHLIVDVAGFFVDAPGATAGGRLVGVEPARMADSRAPTGPTNRYTRVPSGDGEIVNVPIAGRGGIPTTGVDSVVLTLTANSEFPAAAAGHYVTVFAGNGTRPATSNVNVPAAGDIRANTVVTPLGTDGTIDLFLFEMEDVIVDVVGWFTDETVTPAEAGRFHVVPPTREADTRSGLGFERLDDGESANLNPGSVPDSASAVAQNLTIAWSGGWGWVTASPTAPTPNVSNVNVVGSGQTRAALAITPLAADGSEAITGAVPFNPGGHEVLVDVFGYFE